ncbi:hypothetical protein HYW41_05285 [Candidatus Daviesbacteria bacterium]|nr:hypothetical protein [Candidatus Daviesbacteria bacterium]
MSLHTVEVGPELKAPTQILTPPRTAESFHKERTAWLGLDQTGVKGCIELIATFSRDFRRAIEPPKTP